MKKKKKEFYSLRKKHPWPEFCLPPEADIYIYIYILANLTVWKEKKKFAGTTTEVINFIFR